MIDLHAWHHALHQITGTMALRWYRCTADDLLVWSHELHAIAAAMESKATGGGRCPEAEPMPDFILADLSSRS